jgi:hypothetical protein
MDFLSKAPQKNFIYNNLAMKSEVLAANDFTAKVKYEEIERMRLNLEKIVAKKGMQSPEAKWASQALDYKIYEYFRSKK